MHRPARGFVLRAPVLPFATLDGLDRAGLHRLVAQPAIAEAIRLAAPELLAAKGDGIDRALLRYVSRMAGRPTPFGLFSGVVVGGFGPATKISIGTQHRRTTKLDTEYLARLCERLAQELRAEIAYVPNTSLYRAGERLRYVESRLGAGGRAYHLVAIDASPYVEAVLARAVGGATLAELASAITDPEPTREEIAEFIDTLVAEQVLRPTLEPPVTGPDPATAIADQLRALPSGGAAAAALDAKIASADPSEVRVDLELDAEVTLGPRVAAELQRGVDVFRRLLLPFEDSWATFRERFAARYELRAVPLVELLDEESGIGFGARTDDAAQAPLLDDLWFPQRGDAHPGPPAQRQAHLVKLLARGGVEIELTDADVDLLGTAKPETIDSFNVIARVLASSPEAADRGDFRLWVHEVSDGSATRPLGRFCHASPAIDALAREIAAAEHGLAPDALFAEVVHLPDGRVGNIIVRPVLRGHEIAFLGTSGIAPELQIPITDLVVSIEDRRVVLRSQKLGREVRPMFATAHNYWGRNSLAIYRFLASLSQQRAHGGRWEWASFEAAPFLPRVRYKKTIVSRARWRLERAELAGLTPEKLAALRTNLPRWVSLSDGANEMPVDLDNPISVELLRDLPGARVFEWFEPLGTHVHELFVPFVATRAPDVARPPRPTPTATRRFPPGSRWLYAKLYGGTADTEDVLRDLVAPFVREMRDVFDQFFFLRYADPEPHLRLRFSGDPARLCTELLPALSARLGLALDLNQAWRLQLDTYERELERYGDIELAERIFAADSDCVLAIIEATPGADGRDARWRFALRGIDQLLCDLGLDLAARRTLVTTARDQFGAELGIDAHFQRQLGIKYRAHADEITALLAAESEPFAQRSRALAGISTSPDLAAIHVHMHVNRMLPIAARKQELVLYDLLRRHYARATYTSASAGA